MSKEAFDRYNPHNAQIIRRGCKLCSVCGKNKRVKNFYKSSYASSGYKSTCKDCDKFFAILGRNPIKKKEYNARYYQKKKSGSKEK